MTRSARAGALLGPVLVALLVLLPAAPAAAHPLGNFTTNRYTGLVVTPEELRVDHVLDLAELPTVQVRPQLDVDGDGTPGDAELAAYARSACAEAVGGLEATLAGQPLTLVPGPARAALLPGQAGLPTLRLECPARAELSLPGGEATLTVRDRRAGDRVGWREISAQGDRVTLLDSPVRSASVSQRLSVYPQDLLSAPLDERAVTFRVRPGGPALAAAAGSAGVLPRSTDRLTAAFAGLVDDGPLGAPVALLAVLLAVVVGAFHALAPGHGKTVVALYLAGDTARSLRAAVTVGTTVTLTHTAGVLLLGVLISTSATLAPAEAYPWLAAASGLIIAVVGAGLLREALRAGRSGHSHPHPHAHPHVPAVAAVGASAPAAGHLHHHDDHDHSGHEHSGHEHSGHEHSGHEHSGHEHSGHEHSDQVAPVRARGTRLVGLGVAGGLLPSPTALVVLLGAAAVGRAWFGVLLVLAFGVGMAATLTGAGLVALRVGQRLSRHGARFHWSRAWYRVAPAVLAATVTVVGAAIAVRGLSGALG